MMGVESKQTIWLGTDRFQRDLEINCRTTLSFYKARKYGKNKRIIEFDPAFDHRDPDPSKNYGINAVKIRFVLKGEHGAIQFVMSTGWYLPHVQKELEAQPDIYDLLDGPRGWDLGYHSDKPIRKYHKDSGEGDEFFSSSYECEYTKSGRCFYDGSTLNAVPLVGILLEKGDEGIWKELEDYYTQTFGELS